MGDKETKCQQNLRDVKRRKEMDIIRPGKEKDASAPGLLLVVSRQPGTWSMPDTLVPSPF